MSRVFVKNELLAGKLGDVPAALGEVEIGPRVRTCIGFYTGPEVEWSPPMPAIADHDRAEVIEHLTRVLHHFGVREEVDDLRHRIGNSESSGLLPLTLVPECSRPVDLDGEHPVSCAVVDTPRRRPAASSAGTRLSERGRCDSRHKKTLRCLSTGGFEYRLVGG
jgi:hypothetical protein